MIMTVLERVESLRTRNQKNLKSINKDLYRLICTKDLLQIAYISSNSTSENVDSGTNIKTRYNRFTTFILEETINELKKKSFITISRRTKTIKKENKTTFDISFTSLKNRIIKNAIVLILESIYEPSFCSYTNNFEKNYYCTRTIRKIKNQWENIKWIIQGDFNKYPIIINPEILIKILRKKIQDEKFLSLVWNVVQSNLDLNNTNKPNKLGLLLSNIYLSEFDVMFEELEFRMSRLFVEEKQINPLTITTKSEIEFSICKNKSKPKEVHLIRSGKTWIIAISGCKKLAEKTKKIVTLFLTTKLRLIAETINITYLPKSKTRFLGYLLIKKKSLLGINTLHQIKKIKC